jgi:hypothetical protein
MCGAGCRDIDVDPLKIGGCGSGRRTPRRQILLGVGAEMAEGCRKAVASMLLGNAA